jgi:hypothetical protein
LEIFQFISCRIFYLFLLLKDVIDFYREKVDGFRGELVSKLKEEQDEKQMDKMERDVKFLIFIVGRIL